MTTQWTYQGAPVDEPFEDCIGFVYCIYNLLDGRKYIGKKLFFGTRTKTIKGKKKKQKVESDWRNYWGSSEELQADIAKLGESNFKREILHLCKTKGVMSYIELREQVVNDALLKPNEFYNGFVGGKIHRNHLKELINNLN